MALTAVIATAVAAVCAGAAIGVPPALLGLAFLPGIGLVAARPDRRVLPPGLDVRVLTWIGIGAALVLFVTGVARSPDNYGALATGALLATVALSLLWPAPAVVRCCILLAVGSLMGALPALGLVSWPVLGVAAGTAVALVALNRLSAVATATPVATSSASTLRRRRVTGEAVILLAVAGLVGLLVASLLPPPPSAQGQEPKAGEDSRPGRAGSQPPYLQPTDRLDAGGKGSGKGNQVVFRVSAPFAQLWRTTTFDRYDGRTWSRSTEGEAEFRDQGEFVYVPGGPSEQPLNRERFVQRVTVTAASMGLVAGASQLNSVRLPEGWEAVVSGDGTVAPTPPLGRGATYEARSLVPPANPAELVRGSAEGGIPTELRRRYLPIPPLSPRVSELAESVTASSPTAYDKVVALQQWFASSTEVKAGTPALPPEADPVDQFVSVDRGGSSEQAAAAMAVMLRSLGIPARVAVGFLPGQRGAFGGEFVVRGRDAHAWVEAWFPGAGWLAFDPAGRYTARADDESLLSRLRRLLGALRWLIIAVLIVVAAWGAWRALRWWRRQRARPWASRCYARLTRAGRRLGRPRQPYETPVEYCSALASDVADERLVEVGELLTVAAFARAEPPAEAQAWAEEVVSATELTAHRRSSRPGSTVP